MRYFRFLTLAAGIMLAPAFSTVVYAQAEAQKSYQEAKAAYQASNFEGAREAAQKAAQTDPANPEVFLLLGQAQYQLGQIDNALDSWKKTLALAPTEPFAAKMIDVLRAQRTNVEDRIKLVEVMLAEKLYGPVLGEAEKYLADKAISPAARAKLLTLEAEALVRGGKSADAQKSLQEVLVLYPQQADQAGIALLLGISKLSAPDTATEGTAILQKLAADQPETLAGKNAQYELASFALSQGITSEKIAAMVKWITANPQHPQVLDAKKSLISAYLTLSRQNAKPTAETTLNQYDQQALMLAGEVLAATVRADQAAALLQPIFEQLEKHYAANGANAAALAGLDILKKSPLGRDQRLQALRLAASVKNALAMKWLGEQARLGKLPDAASSESLPGALKEAVAALDAIRAENPAEPVGAMQLKLAADVQSLAKTISWPEKIEQLRGPEAWAMEIALPLARTDVDPPLVQAAVDFLMKTGNELTLAPQARDLKDLPLVFSRQVLASISTKHPVWVNAVQWQADLLAKSAQKHFQDNIKAANAATNAKVSEQQRELLQLLAKLVAEKADMAGYARTFLATHLQPWKNADLWSVVEEATGELAKAMPAADRLLAEIDIANLWIDEANRSQQRMLQAGLTVRRELDPLHQKALVRLYELQASLSEESGTLAAIRQIQQNIASRYKALEYYDVAEAAIRVKAENAVPVADEFSAFQLLVLQTEAAGRAFDIFMKQYRAPDKLELLPEHKKLLSEWQNFVVAHPTSALTPHAVRQIFNLGRIYEQHAAFKVAADIYADFAKFAGEQKILSQKIGDRPSTAEQAAFAEAVALDALARKALASWVADRKPNTAPPDKLSDEFAMAIAAYKKFIAQPGDGALAGESLGKIMAVAAEYAKLSSWDVADSIYADLLNSNIKLNRQLNHPERLQFARGVCRLGMAMPEHARQILSAISLGEQPRSGGMSGSEMLAASKDFSSMAIGSVPAGPVTSAPAGMPGGGGGGAPLPAAVPPPIAAPAQQAVVAGDTTTIDAPRDVAKRDDQLLAMVRQEETSRAVKVAQLREATVNRVVAVNQQPAPQQGQQVAQQPSAAAVSDAELAEQEKALTVAYDIFNSIRKNYPQTPSAEQARAEILVMAAHWRGLSQWQRAAALMTQFLADDPTDPQLPQLRLEIARDRLAYSAKPLEKRTTRQEMLAEVGQRFAAARADLNRLLTDFLKEKELRQNAQWDLAMSYLTEARAVDAVSPTLAQGQYVRTAKELREVAAKYSDHPRLGEIPQILWNIGQELDGRGYSEEAIDVWNELVRFDPLNNLAGESLLRIAQTYQTKIKRPLRAAEAYQELNFIRGGNDVGLQNILFQIGADLKNERRWVESLHVLETFVDSFPRHPQAGQALTMAGQIHQTNEAWPDAIAVYRRVIAEYPDGQWVQEAKWSIAECTINLSQWKEAADAYRAFVQAYPQDGKVAEANRRIDILKDLARYQGLINEKDQRKAFDAQYQIGEIVRKQLNNPIKAIIEYRKVHENWPQSYLAADALFAVGETYLSLGEMKKARENLMRVAEKYPTSPSASNALFLVGKSYEDEADKLGKVTRAEQLEKSKELAQREAYRTVQGNRVDNQMRAQSKVAELKKAGKGAMAEVQEASNAAGQQQFAQANVELNAAKAVQQVETMTALELADRQDKVNAALRKAVDAYAATAKIAGGNKADSALLAMATIYDQRLKDSKAAMQTWLEIVRQFSGTNVAEDASWKIAQYYEREGKFAEAVDAYQAFLRNYRRSPNAGAAQFAIAENYEHLGEWVKAMDSYTNYITNFADGPLVNKAKEQINWIKTYRL